MPAAAPTKTCMICGTDVAAKPRVKDAQGRYACEGACAKEMAARLKPAPASRPAPAAQKPAGQVPAAQKPAAPAKPPAPPPRQNAGVDSTLAGLIDSVPTLNAAPCPKCASPLTGDAVVCLQCGYNAQTGKGMRTAVLKEKEEKAPTMSRRRGDWGPSFGILFLIFGGSLSALAALGAVHPLFLGLAMIAIGVTHIVGAVWGIVDAFRQGETVWGILGILGFVVGLPGLAFLYYMAFVNELKWSKSIYLGSIVALVVALGVAIGALGMDPKQFLNAP